MWSNQFLFKPILFCLTGFFFFICFTVLPLGSEFGGKILRNTTMKGEAQKESNMISECSNLITLFMCGDVMTGRGIDQILPHPGNPRLYEPYVQSAKNYVRLAENENGPIPHPVNCSYIWGDALKELDRIAPDVRLINLETSITKSNDFDREKGIHYKMHPENICCITAADIDFCSLANNHVLDWGYSGLTETLETLKNSNVKYAGAGQNLQNAESPAIFKIQANSRVLVFSYGLTTSGIPNSWKATEEKPGVNLLSDLSPNTIHRIKMNVEQFKKEGDIVVASIHWGDNWGYEIPSAQTELAHKLIDQGGFDVIHGHSSHHVKAIEVYQNKLILYGCGDFINDYEGISGYEEFKSDLGLMYFASVDPMTGDLMRLKMTPTQIKQFQVQRAAKSDAQWLKNTLNREGEKFGTSVQLTQDDRFILKWD